MEAVTICRRMILFPWHLLWAAQLRLSSRFLMEQRYKEKHRTDRTALCFFHLCTNFFRGSSDLAVLFGIRTMISSRSQSRALQIKSRCSRFTRSHNSWYISLIVDALIPVALDRSACVQRSSPNFLDSKILIIPTLLPLYSNSLEAVSQEIGRL